MIVYHNVKNIFPVVVIVNLAFLFLHVYAFIKNCDWSNQHLGFRLTKAKLL
jgi:hypothetical protein